MRKIQRFAKVGAALSFFGRMFEKVIKLEKMTMIAALALVHLHKPSTCKVRITIGCIRADCNGIARCLGGNGIGRYSYECRNCKERWSQVRPTSLCQNDDPGIRPMGVKKGRPMGVKKRRAMLTATPTNIMVRNAVSGEVVPIRTSPQSRTEWLGPGWAVASPVASGAPSRPVKDDISNDDLTRIVQQIVTQSERACKCAMVDCVSKRPVT